jgi:hypothetical protein
VRTWGRPVATADAYFSGDRPALSPRLRNARVILLAWAVFSAVWAIVAMLTLTPSAPGAGALVGSVLPELAGGVLALRIAALPRWPLIALTALEILLSAADIISGSTRGIVQLVVPVVVLVLLLLGYRQRRTAKPTPYGQDGAAFFQWLALGVLAFVIVASLAVAGVGTTIGGGAGTVVCHIVGAKNCGTTASGTNGTGKPGAKNGDTNGSGKKNDSGKKNGSGKKPADKAKCHGFWGCTWHYTGGQVYGFGKGVVKSVYQMGDGIVTSVMHPTQFLKGIEYAADHPGQALKSIFLGDAEKDWANGDYGEAIGDVVTNTGTLLIPYADIGTAAGDAGKVGKLGELGKLGKLGDAGKLGDVGKLGKLGELAADGDRAAADAAKAAKDGDVGGAQKAAGKADGDAKKAEDQGRKDGCKVAALGEVRVTPLIHLGGRFAAPAREGCGSDEQNNLNKAEKDKKNADQAINDAWSKKVSFTQKQLQHEFNKADKGFDIKGNWNKANGAAYEKAIRDFIKKPGIRRFRGTYRGQPALFFYDDATKKVVYLHPDGGFWGVQIQLKGTKLLYLTRDAKLGGG